MTNQGLDFLTSLTTFTMALIGEGKKLNVKRKYLGHPNPVLCFCWLTTKIPQILEKMILMENSADFRVKKKKKPLSYCFNFYSEN